VRLRMVAFMLSTQRLPPLSKLKTHGILKIVLRKYGSHSVRRIKLRLGSARPKHGVSVVLSSCGRTRIGLHFSSY
jgi:hypothetical protein